MFARSPLIRSAIVAFGFAASVGGPASIAIAQQEGQILVRGVAPGTKMMLVNYRDLNLNYEAHRDVLTLRPTAPTLRYRQDSRRS